MFLTAYFFICFIQFLQRVQQFLWGENVRGSLFLWLSLHCWSLILKRYPRGLPEVGVSQVHEKFGGSENVSRTCGRTESS